ncbi:MAG TPA: hypothetical protein V6D15_19480 [Oculatellaceae cyanobacterium]
MSHETIAPLVIEYLRLHTSRKSHEDFLYKQRLDSLRIVTNILQCDRSKKADNN